MAHWTRLGAVAGRAAMLNPPAAALAESSLPLRHRPLHRNGLSRIHRQFCGPRRRAGFHLRQRMVLRGGCL